MEAVPPPNAARPFVLFRVRGQWFALPLVQVQAIASPGRITRVPNAPRGVKGVVDWRGKVWTLYDLGECLDLPDPPTHALYMILLGFKRSDMEVGFVAEEVREVREIPLSSLETVADREGSSQGGVTLEELQVRVLDGERFFMHPSISVAALASPH
jgi:purine-binding chemotaxis protein CheW